MLTDASIYLLLREKLDLRFSFLVCVLCCYSCVFCNLGHCSSCYVTRVSTLWFLKDFTVGEDIIPISIPEFLLNSFLTAFNKIEAMSYGLHS